MKHDFFFSIVSSFGICFLPFQITPKIFLEMASNLSEIKPFLLLTDWPRYLRLLPLSSKNRDGLFRGSRKNLSRGGGRLKFSRYSLHSLASDVH